MCDVYYLILIIHSQTVGFKKKKEGKKENRRKEGKDRQEGRKDIKKERKKY
jgi:hypothetical protein